MSASAHGAAYFGSLRRSGLGLGINPSDFHDSYIRSGATDFLEVTAPSSRLRGFPGYRDLAQRPVHGMRRRTIAELVREIPVLVHSSNVNPAYPKPCSHEDLEELRDLVWSASAPWVTEDLGVWLMNERHVYPFFMPMPYTPEVLSICIENVRNFQDFMGVPFNAEFPPTSIIVGDMHPFDFFRHLVEETGCGMCVDVGHVLSYQLARGASPMADAHRLPWEHVCEIHVAGGGIDLTTEGFQYQDGHGDHNIVTACLDMLDQVIAHATNLKAITLEVFGARQPAKALRTLGELRNRVSVADWLMGHSTDWTLPNAGPSTRASALAQQVGLYDTLHTSASIEESLLGESRAALVGLIAPNERRRWEYERQARVHLLGGALTGYFPVTTALLTGSGELDAEVLHARVLAAAPADGGDVWPALVKTFRDLLDGEAASEVVHQAFEAEVWMNECVRSGSDATRTLALDVFSKDPGAPMPGPVTVTFRGGRFHRQRAHDSPASHVCANLSAPGIGEAPCCTGR